MKVQRHQSTFFNCHLIIVISSAHGIWSPLPAGRALRAIRGALAGWGLLSCLAATHDARALKRLHRALLKQPAGVTVDAFLRSHTLVPASVRCVALNGHDDIEELYTKCFNGFPEGSVCAPIFLCRSR